MVGPDTNISESKADDSKAGTSENYWSFSQPLYIGVLQNITAIKAEIVLHPKNSLKLIYMILIMNDAEEEHILSSLLVN